MRAAIWTFVFLCSFSGGGLAAQAPRAAQAKAKMTPVEAIQELDRLVDSYRVGKNLTEEDEVFNRGLKKRILRGTFDLAELAKLSLDKHWMELSKIQQARFVELLTSLLEERSVFAKERAIERGEEKSYSINYQGQNYLDDARRDALAKSVIRMTKKGITAKLHYKLKREAQEWKIYDVIMDGASLVENYRYSFNKIITNHGVGELFSRMQKKLDEFRKKRRQDQIQPQSALR